MNVYLDESDMKRDESLPEANSYFTKLCHFYIEVNWLFNIISRFSHSTPLLRSLHWLPVAGNIRFQTQMLACLQSQIPPNTNL